MSSQPIATIDHFVYAVPDLKAAIADFHTRTGVEPKYGGKHLALGTHNALVSLGDGMYFEILAPDPEQNNPDGLKRLGLDKIDKPFLMNWAIGVRGFNPLRELLNSIGFDLTEIVKGSRKTADGANIFYEAANIVAQASKQSQHLPFVIDWGTTLHPSSTSPIGCTFNRFEIHTPNANRLGQIVGALKLPITVRPHKIFGMDLKIGAKKAALTLN